MHFIAYFTHSRIKVLKFMLIEKFHIPTQLEGCKCLDINLQQASTTLLNCKELKYAKIF